MVFPVFRYRRYIIVFLVILAIVIGWTSVKEDVGRDYLPVDPVEIRKRYLRFSIPGGLGTLWMSQPMSDHYLPRNNLNGEGPRSTANTFRVTVIVTLNSVSGGFHGIVSSIDTFYSYYSITL